MGIDKLIIVVVGDNRFVGIFNYQKSIMSDKDVENVGPIHVPITLNGIGKKDGKQQNKLSRLLQIQQLQRSIVKQNMHNAMSPLSAISGYLELIDMTLEQDASVDQIEHYRKKIELGITEVNEIFQQLNAMYEQEQFEAEEDFLEVDLNWAVKNVCSQIDPSNNKINFNSSLKPLHVHTALYTVKLIMYKLVSYAIKCIPKGDQAELRSSEEEGKAKFEITFSLSEQKASDIRAVLRCKNEKDEYESIKNSSLNEGLLASRKLVDQIEGYLSFKMMGDSTGRLSLSLPLV